MNTPLAPEIRQPGSGTGHAPVPPASVLAGADRARLSDRAIAILARTAFQWFAPDCHGTVKVRVEDGRVYLTGHAGNARRFPDVETALRHVPGVACTENAIVIDAAGPARAEGPRAPTPRYGRLARGCHAAAAWRPGRRGG
ncbi:BON domain-containing protein [Ralstonia solanacearum]|uniref:BON domain-containing protein n=1 Tax=Ralstonia solanacearum TaxID=305 RepID=A0AAW5ZIS1_RALSL|nr:BON domain-containing protein [Ralstonia solanacearum]MDB0569986.1 BON domain-containing protein [Ralstonia solanacearum]